MLNQHKMLICIVWTNTRFNSLVETVIHDSLASRKNLNLNTQGHFWLETQIRNSLNCSTIEKFFLRAQPPCVNLLQCYSLIIFKLLSFHGDLMYPRLPSNSAAKATLNFRFPCLHFPGARKRGACYQPSVTPGWEWKPGLFACLASTHPMELHPKSLTECSLDLKIQLQIKYWGQKKIMLFFPHKFIPFWGKEICGSTDASSGSMALFFHFYYEEIRLL